VPRTAPVNSSAPRSQLTCSRLRRGIWSQASICQRRCVVSARPRRGRRPDGAGGSRRPLNQRRRVRSPGKTSGGKVLASAPRRNRAPQVGWTAFNSKTRARTGEGAAPGVGETEW
jgi:hypothetical protein